MGNEKEMWSRINSESADSIATPAHSAWTRGQTSEIRRLAPPRNQPRNGGFDVDLRGIENSDTEYGLVAQNQGQFCSAQNRSIDLRAVFQGLDDVHQTITRFRQNDSRHQLIHVLPVDVGLVFFVGPNHLHSPPPLCVLLTDIF